MVNTVAELSRVAERKSLQASAYTRHHCFLSYHKSDIDEVATFVERFGDAFFPHVIGVSDSDPIVESDDSAYIMQRIREKYLRSTTVTIVLIGRCTWARRYIDWEISSTLRNDRLNRRSGLMAVTLPSISQYIDRKVPARLQDNILNVNQGYARWWQYPRSSEQLRQRIDVVHGYRASRAHLIENRRARKKHSSPCP